MSSKGNTIALVESALLTALTVILAIAGIYIPLLGYLLMIIAVPFIIITVRHSLRYVIISIIASAILVTFVTFPTYGIYIAMMGGFVGCIMGLSIKKKKDSSTSIFYGALTASVSLMIMISLATLISGVSIIETVDQILGETVRVTETMGLGEIISESGVSMTDITDLFKMVIPSSLVLSGAIFAVFNYFISTIILKRLGMDTKQAKTFSEFSLPGNILFGTTFILVLTYFSGKLNIVDSEALFVNVLNVFTYVFLVQGVAVLFFFLEKRKLGKGIKILSVFLIFILGIILPVAMFGWLDSAFDFRKLRGIKYEE